jgi:hypothetical protein
MVMMGCGDSDSGSTEDKDDIKVEGDTLVHTSPKLEAANKWGGTPGTANADGSYEFDGTSIQYNGDGAMYNFPAPKAGDTWKISDYALVEITLKTVSGSVSVIVKNGNGDDLFPYPSGSGNRYPTLSADADFTYQALVSDAGTGFGFQRNQGGPATVKIDKVVFKKMPRLTVTFSGGDYAAMPARPPLEVVSGSTLTNDQLKPLPTWAGHTFIGWKNTTDNVDFDLATPITKDITLTAQWADGDPVEVSMALDLNPDNWGEIPPHPNTGYTGAVGSAPLNSNGWDHTAEYAAHSYDDGVLTLTFDGNNRQRFIIPLSQAQIDALLWTEEAGVTFIFDADVKLEDGTEPPEALGFRCHLANPTTGASWNGTATGNQGPLSTHMEEFNAFANTGDGWINRIGFFAIQSMYKDANGSDVGQKDGFPVVIITIRSLTIALD